MNPISFFRKYQKTMLAVAAVGAMFAFGILPILSDWMGQSGGAMRGGADGGIVDAESVAVSWSGGELRENEVQGLRVLRSQLRQFQQGVIQTAAERGAQPRTVVIPGTSSEASVVESMLLADEADKLGITIGDQAVLRHLKEHLANDVVDENKLAAILRDTTGGRLRQQQLVDGFKTELAAHQVRILANGAAYDGSLTDTAVSPGQAYEYFKRLYRRMEAEVLEVPVEDYVAKVTEEPTAEEIAESYEEYKEVFPSPITPTPGFKEPARAAFQWVKADYPTFLEAAIATVTDAEIETYYNQNKSSFKKISLPTTPSTSDLISPDGVEASSESTISPELPSSESVETEVPATVEGAATETIIEQPVIEQPAVEVPAVQDAVVEPAAVEAVIEEGAAPSPRFQEAEEVAEAAAEEVAEVVAETTEVVGEVVEDAVSESTAVVESAVEAATEAAGVAEVATESAAPEYQPISEVRDTIARTLALPKATEAISAAVAEVQGVMATYFEDYMYWDTTPEEEKGTQPPVPDLKALAEKLGMISGDIPLISALEAEEYELGRAYELDFSTQNFRRIPFTLMGFSPSLPVYKAGKISASDVDSKFVFWKTDQKAAYTPSLEEARPAVIKHWKMKKALELAKAAAETDFAAKLRGKDQSLQSMFGESLGAKIKSTGQFTWMSSGATPSGQGAPRISFVEGVQYPGDDFMGAASKLDSGEVAVTTNYPETSVYVVYMKGVTGNDEDLRTLFLNEGVKQPVLYMARQDKMRSAAEWYMGMEKERGVKWARTPQADR